MVKWKGALFIIVTVIVALLLSVGADVLYGYVATTKIEPPTVAHANFEYKAENEYLGNKIYDEDGVLKSAFDVRKILSLSAEDDLKVSISGVSNGDFVDFADVDASEVAISVNGRNVRLVDGDKSTYSYLSNNLVLQNDIDLNLLPEESRDVTFKMKHDIFGNGKSIISAKRTGEKARYFGVSIRFIGYGQNVVDTRFSGKTVSAGEEVVLDDYLYCGIPVEIGNGKKSDAKFVEKTKANFTNCVFENSYRNVAISRSDVEFVRCVFNNAAEANVSLKTTTGNNSTLTFRHRKLQRCWHYELVRRNRGRIVILHDKYPQHKILLLEIVRQRARYGGERQRRLLQNRKFGFPGGNKQRQCQEKSCRMQRKILLFVVDFRDLLKKRREKRGETQRALRKPPEKNHGTRKQHRFGVFVGCKCLRIRRCFVHCARRKTAILSLTQKFALFLRSLSKQPLKTCGKIKNIIYLHLLKFTRCLN